MSSPVEICNEALRRVGAATITTLDDDSTEARCCKAVYTSELEGIVDEYDWRFATTRLELAADVEAPAWGYAYAYTLPSTVIRVLSVDDGSLTFQLEWQREGDQVLCDHAGPIYLQVIQRIDDTARFPPTFEKALSYAIAAEICMPLTQNHALWRDLVGLADKAVKVAQNRDGGQGRSRAATTNTLQTARY